MEVNWISVMDFSLIAIFIGMASYIKSRFKIFQKFLVPTSIIAGFIGLLLGPEIFDVAPLDINRLGNMVYHLMAIGFIALSLQDRRQKRNKDIFNSGAYIVSTYLVQGVIGFLTSLILAYTIYPELFPMFGLLLPLSYGQGPGQAFSIGSQWEQLGFINGGNIGLTFATFGFLWACIVGVPLMNYLVRKRKNQQDSIDMMKKSSKINNDIEIRENTSRESIDKFSIQLFLIGIVYFITYITLKGVSTLLLPLGTLGATLSQLLWGFHFMIGSLYGILLKTIIRGLKKRKAKIYYETDNYLLQRISGGTFDFMITASIAAISIFALRVYVVPIIIITTIGGIITVIYTVFMCNRVFKTDVLENILGFYGMQTGTLSTGLALLKEVDPNFDTSVTDNLVMGSATAMFFGFPLMILLSLPIIGYTTNQPIMYLYTIFGFLVYLGILYLILYKNRVRE